MSRRAVPKAYPEVRSTRATPVSRDNLSTTAVQSPKAQPQMRGLRKGPRGMGSSAKPRDFAGSLKHLAGMLRGQGAKLALILACRAGSVLRAVLVPWLLGHATDRVVQAAGSAVALDFAGLAQQLLFAALVRGGAVALNFSQAWVKAGLVQGISLRCRQQAHDTNRNSRQAR